MYLIRAGPALTQERKPTTPRRDRSTVVGLATTRNQPTPRNQEEAPKIRLTRTAATEHKAGLPEESGEDHPTNGEPLAMGLQGGSFKKLTTQKRCYRPIRGSWAFTRSK